MNHVPEEFQPRFPNCRHPKIIPALSNAQKPNDLSTTQDLTRPGDLTMNLSLTDPFVLAQDYPESTTGSLRSGHATCVRFNRKGDFLAAGRVDGVVVLFDVETQGVARKLKGHTRQIQSLSWSRDGRYLLTSSQDWKCNIWDLQDGSIVRTVRFEAPVYIAEFHPWNQYVYSLLFEQESRS